jgi:hypothetical protein
MVLEICILEKDSYIRGVDVSRGRKEENMKLAVFILDKRSSEDTGMYIVNFENRSHKRWAMKKKRRGRSEVFYIASEQR